LLSFTKAVVAETMLTYYSILSLFAMGWVLQSHFAESLIGVSFCGVTK